MGLTGTFWRLSSATIVLLASCVVHLSCIRLVAQQETDVHNNHMHQSIQGNRLDVERGSWGGSHILVEVGESDVSIQFDCGDGRIPVSFKTDRNGHFSVKGSFVVQHAGPSRDDQTAQDAVYEGSIVQGVMTLKATLPTTKTVIGPFTARHGELGRVYRCH